MKKAFILSLMMISMISISCSKSNNNLRYEEIKKDFEEALIKMLDATGLSNNNNGCDEKTSKSVIVSSDFLINNGYLKKEKIKDINNKKYCSLVAVTYKKDDCGIGYDTYLKCEDYEEEGYNSWDF